jgi:hypothetical protein
MRPKIAERNWRGPARPVAHAWIKNHWIMSHRIGSQDQQILDADWSAAAVDAPSVPCDSIVAGGADPPPGRRGAEEGWENEGGATEPPVLVLCRDSF